MACSTSTSSTRRRLRRPRNRARRARSELWRNRGDGTFVDVTDKAGVGYPGWGMGAVAADFDNDGWDDLYVTCYGPNRLYRNNGDGTFAGCDREGGRRRSAMVDRCGVRRLRRRRLARSVRGQLRRRASRRAAGVRQGQVLRVSRDSGSVRPARVARLRRFALSQQGRWHVRGRVDESGCRRSEAGGSAWVSCGATSTATAVPISSSPTMRARTFSTRTTATARSSMSPCRRGPRSARTEKSRAPWAWQSATTIIQAAGASSSRISRTSTTRSIGTTRAFQFTDVSFASQTAKASIPLVGWGTHFLDYDNDGWLDLLVVNGHVYPQVERAGLAAQVRAAQAALPQQPERHLHGITSTAGSALSEPSVSRGSAAGDLDNDGDLDVVINNLDGAPTVLRNDGGNRRQFSRGGPRGPHRQSQRRWRRRHRQRRRSRPARRAAQRRQLSVAQRRAAALRTRNANEGRLGRGPMAERGRPAIP